jgi:hypothetical protein
MKAHRVLLAATDKLLRIAGAMLASVPTLIVANHLYVAPSGAQLDADFDSAAASRPSPDLSSQLRALEDLGRGAAFSSEIRAARLPRHAPPPGELS